MYSQFKRPVSRLLSTNNITIEFVDIGSRNGILELDSIAEFVNAYGFEPNPVEYEKLVVDKTDAAKVGIKSPKYKSISYSNNAVADKVGSMPFHITRGPGVCGLLEPDIDKLKQIRWKGKTYNKSLAEDVFTVEKIMSVDVTTIDSFVKSKAIKHIDYLKIDVEGSDYEVLQGAGDFLRNVSVVKVEVFFTPFRKKQKLFSDVDLLLRKYDFDLLNYQIAPAQVGFKERTYPWSFGPTIGFPERYGQPLSGDAIYINRSVLDAKRAIAQAAVLIDKNYLDEALFILRHNVKVLDTELLELLSTYKGQWRIRLLDHVFKMGKKLVRTPHLWK